MRDDSALGAGGRQCRGCGAVGTAAAAQDAAGEAVLRRGRLPSVRPHHRVAGVLPDAHRARLAGRCRATRGRPGARTGGPGGIRRERRGEGRVPAARRGVSVPMCRSTWQSRNSSRCAQRLREKRPDLQVCVVPADFMDVVALPTQVPSLPRLGFFPGSTIGNLDPVGGTALFGARARRAWARLVVPGRRRSAQGPGDPVAGL